MRKIIKIKQTVILFHILYFLTILLIYHTPCFAQSKPVANINGIILTDYDLQLALNEIMPAGVFHGGFSSEKRATYKPQAIEKMIDKELLYQEALKRGIKADTKTIEKSRSKMISKMGSLEKYQAALIKTGITDKHYIRILKKNEITKKIIRIEIDSNAKITGNEALEYYQKNVTSFMRPKSIKLRHILISVKPNATVEEKNKLKEKARELRLRILAGEDMARIATDYSNDKYRIKGGDYGFIHKGRLDPDLEKHVMKLEINKLSNIITTRFGYHIARIEAVQPPTQLSYKEVSEKIKMQLSETKKKSLEKALITRLRKNAEIIIY